MISDGPSYASASRNAFTVCKSFAPIATRATYTLPYVMAINPKSFFASSFPPAANFATAPRGVDFDTTRPTYLTRADKCHVSHVVADTESWEQKMAQVLEDMDEVVCYVKNQNLGYTVPYTLDGQERSYYPDFIAHVDDGVGQIVGAPRGERHLRIARAVFSEENKLERVHGQPLVSGGKVASSGLSVK